MKQAIKQDQLIYKLHKTVFLLDKIADSSLQQALNLGLAQFLILKTINQSPGISQLKASQQLDLTQAAISKQMKPMLRAGLISRTVNPKNRREHVLNVTSKGKMILSAADKILRNNIGKVFQCLSDKDKIELCENSDRITNEINAKGIGYFCNC